MLCHLGLQRAQSLEPPRRPVGDFSEGLPASRNDSSRQCRDDVASENQIWQEISARAIRNVVVVKFCHTTPFDGEAAGVSEATGFVVDSERGYVLTNRHVAGPGPFWGSCIFDSQEEAVCYPVYIDPIHDFAFLKYDPKVVQHLSIDGLLLNSNRATVGLQVLVVGNDAAETISIIPGIISRVDRNAPEYEGPYRDFNINYYQANMNLSGGISGSPVVTADGSAIGMVSGGLLNGESICYFLPLCPVRKALDCLRTGSSVPRGDIQCQFLARPYHECRRLGLHADWEKRFRAEFTDAGGLLVTNKVLPSGPASGKVMVGDILLEVNGHLILHFAELENALDANINRTVEMKLLRDGQLVVVIIGVINLHNITPRHLVSIGELLFCHDLSYVQAMKYGVPIAGVHVAASAGPSTIGDGGSGWIIQKMGNLVIRSLDEFLQVLLSAETGHKIIVTYAHLENLHKRMTDVLTLNVRSELTVGTRENETGIWRLRGAVLVTSEKRGRRTGSFLTPRPICNPRLTDLLSGLVHVESRAYVPLDGFPAMYRQGMGVVVDAQAGLVVVSRLVIPHKACHVTLILASSVILEGHCIFWHPSQCYVVVQYDSSLAPEYVRSVKLSERRVCWGEEAKFVRFGHPDRILHGDVRVGTVRVGGTARAYEDPYLRHRPINADLVNIEAPSGSRNSNGVLIASDRSVLAIWLPFLGGVTTPTLLAVMSKIQKGIIPTSHLFPAEFEEVSISTARSMGVSEQLIGGIVEASNHCPQMYRVKKITAFGVGDVSNSILEDDLLISMNGQICTNRSQFDIASSRKVRTVVLRRDSIVSVELRSVQVDNLETSRCVKFCGAYVQRPHLAVRNNLDKLPSEVYITHVVPGSPADRYSLPSESFITMINGKAVKDFETFVDVVRALSEDSSDRDFTVVAITLKGMVVKLGMRQNSEFFPLMEWSLEDNNKSVLERCGDFDASESGTALAKRVN